MVASAVRTGSWSLGATVAQALPSLALRSVAILAQGQTLEPFCCTRPLPTPRFISAPASRSLCLAQRRRHAGDGRRGRPSRPSSRITDASCAPIWGICREFRLASGSPPIPACFCWGRVGEPPPTAFRGCERPRRFAARLRSRAFPMKQTGSGRRNNAREQGNNLCSLDGRKLRARVASQFPSPSYPSSRWLVSWPWRFLRPPTYR